MTQATKQRFAGAVCALSAGIMMFCMSQMAPHGMAGNVRKVKQYFAGVMVAFAVSLPCGVAYYYYRAKRGSDAYTGNMRTQVDALAHAGKRPASTEPPTQRTHHSEHTS